MKHLNIALVAHDGRKDELLSWVKFNATMLSKHNLFATGTTGRLISELPVVVDGKETFPFKGKVTRLLSGPLGGDQQIGAMIAERKKICLSSSATISLSKDTRMTYRHCPDSPHCTTSHLRRTGLRPTCF